MVTMGIDIERRQFISALCSAMVAWLLSARSQQSAMPVVAVIDAGAADADARYVARLPQRSQ